MNATCPPLPRYDIRLYDTLAAKLADGVKVRIVVSDPTNRGAIGSGGYSQIKSLNEISDVLRKRLELVTAPHSSKRSCSTPSGHTPGQQPRTTTRAAAARVDAVGVLGGRRRLPLSRSAPSPGQDNHGGEVRGNRDRWSPLTRPTT
ncbi:hypothetical protein AB0I54_12305 [Streptomyces sp. NPDC050625]|uniref:hypothetical protein n=1 Tax=Streptomyces sp. NPDC050625 TaxID=3154629 RepID=UPI0034435456